VVILNLSCSPPDDQIEEQDVRVDEQMEEQDDSANTTVQKITQRNDHE
jgi:hypothetical protein